MKGYWHLTAIAVGISGLAVMLSNHLFLLGLYIWLFYLFYQEKLRKTPFLLTLFFSLVFYFYLPNIDQMKEAMTPPEFSSFSGKVTTPIEWGKQKIEFVLKNNDNTNVLVTYFLADDEQVTSEKISIKYGSQCEVFGQAEIPPESRNPGQFDYRDYLLTKGIPYQMIVDSLDQVNCSGASPFYKIFDLRLKLTKRMDRMLSEGTREWVNALIFGDSSHMDQETIERFQRWGLSHILAISGLHVGILTTLFYFLLLKLNITTREKAQLILCLFLPIYAILAGGEPSVLRASGMILFFIILQMLRLKLSRSDLLSIIFIMLVFINPYMFYHLGFQFSFLVTFGLILSGPIISATKTAFFRVLRISFIAQMVILPLQINYFFIFEPLSIVMNVIIVPYFSLFVIPYMFFLMVLALLPIPVVIFFDSIFKVLHKNVLWMTEWIDHYLNNPLVIGEFSVFMSIVYYFLFFIMMKYLQQHKIWKSFYSGFLLCIVLIFITIKPYLSPEGNVTMLDIGQGDTFVMELPYRKGVFMMDGASEIVWGDFEGTDRVYKQMIRPYLYSRGIDTIDALIISHKHLDHMGSVQYLIKDFSVNYLIISPYYALDPEEEKEFLDRGIQIKRVGAKESFDIRGHSFSALAPDRDQGQKNDNSLVLFTEFGGKKWLFTGDIGKKDEREIGRNFEDLKVDVLKVAHHGSNTSTDPHFLMQIEPSVAWIPVGMNNFYGHPAEEVLQTLREQGIQIFRTDLDGAVQFRYRKNSGTFWKYGP